MWRKKVLEEEENLFEGEVAQKSSRRRRRKIFVRVMWRKKVQEFLFLLKLCKTLSKIHFLNLLTILIPAQSKIENQTTCSVVQHIVQALFSETKNQTTFTMPGR